MKSALRLDSVEGRIIAAPMPWANRAAMSIGPLTESPATTDDSMKTTMPTRNSSRRPRRSPTRPTVMSSDAKTREYTAFIHWASVAVSDRSSMTTGSATLTIVASMMTSETPNPMVSSAAQSRRVMRGAAATSGVGEDMVEV